MTRPDRSEPVDDREQVAGQTGLHLLRRHSGPLAGGTAMYLDGRVEQHETPGRVCYCGVPPPRGQLRDVDG